MRRFSLAAAVLASLAAPALADDAPVAVRGSKTAFPRAIGAQNVGLKLTGVALRTKAIFNVYAVGSYLQDGVAAKTADDLVKADAVKVLYLVMERDVSGEDMTGAIKTAVGRAHPDQFAAELAQVGAAFGERGVKKGDHVMMTAVPNAGLRVRVGTAEEVAIKTPAFAKAVWEVYLGADPISEAMRAGLTELLPK